MNQQSSPAGGHQMDDMSLNHKESFFAAPIRVEYMQNAIDYKDIDTTRSFFSLLDKVVNLGNLGEIVKVKDGYARNFLIPSGRARRATEANKAEFEAKRVELEKAAAAKLAEMQAQGAKLGGTTVKLTQKAGVDGRLFGSVTNHDISAELTKQGFPVVKSQIRMPNGPLKIAGDHAVTVALHTDVAVDNTVAVYGCVSTPKNQVLGQNRMRTRNQGKLPTTSRHIPTRFPPVIHSVIPQRFRIRDYHEHWIQEQPLGCN